MYQQELRLIDRRRPVKAVQREIPRDAPQIRRQPCGAVGGHAVPGSQPGVVLAFLGVVGALQNVVGDLRQYAPLDELAECVAAPGSVEDSFDAAETGRLISAFLRTLPEETRSIFLRRYWYCDATADIAARYGLTESKVRVTLHRTRGKLAAYLQERGAAL